MRRELPHQQEERDDDEVVVRKPRVGEVLERIEERREVATGQVEVAAETHDEHRDADRDADEHQRQHDAEDRKARFDAAHGLSAVRSRRALM